MSRHEWIDPEDKTTHIVVTGCAPGPLAREILRLAEEVERLKAEVKAHEEAGPAALRVGRVQGEAEERARIRRELLEAVRRCTVTEGMDWMPKHGVIDTYNFSDEIDRIVPGEG